jgi:hypothetical protein
VLYTTLIDFLVQLYVLQKRKMAGLIDVWPISTTKRPKKERERAEKIECSGREFILLLLLHREQERKQLTSMSSLDAILLDSEGTENFIRGLMSSLVYSTKASNSIPGDEGEC